MEAWWHESASMLCFLALASVAPGHALRTPASWINGGHPGGLVTKEGCPPNGTLILNEEEEKLPAHQRQERAQRSWRAFASGGAEAVQARNKSAAGASLVRKLADTKPGELAVKDTPFRNILLVIHCRLPFAKDPEVVRAICAQRAPLFQGYKRFFRDVHYMTRDTCPINYGDPHGCLADLLEGGRAAERDGLFYMHFDALIRPRHLGINFDKSAIGSFRQTHVCLLNATGWQVNCSWTAWHPWRAEQLWGAINDMREMGPEFRVLDNMTVYLGNDDLFYLPRSVFHLYTLLAKVVERHGLHHEAGGPTIRHILQQLTSVPLVSMNCSGSCCSHLEPGDALSPDFRCGHPFNLTEAAIQKAVTSSINLQRTTSYANSSSFGHWQRLLGAALA